MALQRGWYRGNALQCRAFECQQDRQSFPCPQNVTGAARYELDSALRVLSDADPKESAEIGNMNPISFQTLRYLSTGGVTDKAWAVAAARRVWPLVPSNSDLAREAQFIITNPNGARLRGQKMRKDEVLQEARAKVEATRRMMALVAGRFGGDYVFQSSGEIPVRYQDTATG